MELATYHDLLGVRGAYPFAGIEQLDTASGPLRLLRATGEADELDRYDYPGLAAALAPVMPGPSDFPWY